MRTCETRLLLVVVGWKSFDYPNVLVRFVIAVSVNISNLLNNLKEKGN